ncbi:SIMPL domain-containing protein [Sphingomonas sp.]|jgi:hypothetical protein|uniref:SIMPL domain-containing protein n=1 Tax=Sphingomonas sp. TaxID=28214 RepID=UPI002D7FED52|nr:SIMPL domain-containing protein [Sphingomonas sp.]HEU0042959.1 SIMPL domain-containing protein [Sphingomonas sp.]
MRSLLALALCSLSTTALAQVQVTPSPDAPVITLSVQETVEVAPDIATVGAGVETIAPTAAAALQQNSVKMRRVIAAIRAAGVAERDVRTNTVRVGARYDYPNRVRSFQGYAATNTVTVLLRDIAAVGPFLDRVTAAGATEVNGPTFAVEQANRYSATARDRAVERAAGEAQAYARRAGFKQARLLSIMEGGSFVQPFDIVVTGESRQSAAPVSAPPPPVLGGQQSVGVSITAMYRMER